MAIKEKERDQTVPLQMNKPALVQFLNLQYIDFTACGGRKDYKTVHNFKDLSRDSAHALINDIITVYHYYCTGKIILRSETNSSEFHGIDIAGTEKLQLPTIPKVVLKNVNKCKDTFGG